MLENLPIYVKKVTCYSVSVMALSSVAVDLGPLNAEKLKHAISLIPNSCIFEFSTFKHTNHLEERLLDQAQARASYTQNKQRSNGNAARFQKVYTCPRPPFKGTKFWRIGPKVQKTPEKCHNPPCWHKTNVPERYGLFIICLKGVRY